METNDILLIIGLSILFILVAIPLIGLLKSSKKDYENYLAMRKLQSGESTPLKRDYFADMESYFFSRHATLNDESLQDYFTYSSSQNVAEQRASDPHGISIVTDAKATYDRPGN